MTNSPFGTVDKQLEEKIQAVIDSVYSGRWIPIDGRETVRFEHTIDLGNNHTYDLPTLRIAATMSKAREHEFGSKEYYLAAIRHHQLGILVLEEHIKKGNHLKPFVV